jgi:hypothetical protein
MARIIRLDFPTLLRLLLLILLVLAVAGSLLALRGWLAARPSVPREPGESDWAEPEGPDLAAVATSAGVVHLRRAHFCLDVHNHKPLVSKSVFSRRVDYIYCYSVVTAPPEGVTILHRWILAGQPVFERRLRAQGKNCRLWSRRHLMVKEPGTGRVEIIVEDGNMLGSVVFTLL